MSSHLIEKSLASPCSHPVIIDADSSHLSAILDIYNHAIIHTTATWDSTLVDLENRRKWWKDRVDNGFPVLVAIREDTVLGYASYGPFRPFHGYRYTVEHSVYVKENAQRRGIASLLIATLEQRAKQQGMHVMIGGIDASNEASLQLHTKLGYLETARMPEVGHKFGRYLDLVLMQKKL